MQASKDLLRRMLTGRSLYLVQVSETRTGSTRRYRLLVADGANVLDVTRLTLCALGTPPAPDGETTGHRWESSAAIRENDANELLHTIRYHLGDHRFTVVSL